MVSLPRIPDVFPPALLLGLLSVASLALVIGLTGISIDWVSLTNAYEQRDEYSAASSSVVAYALGWTGGGALAALAAYGYHLRSWFYMAIGFGGLVAIYMLTGYKSYLLGAALVLVLALIFGRSREVRVWRVYLIFGGAISAAGVMDWVTGSNFFTSLGVRRAFSTAGINTGYFIDFFEKHPKYGLRHSVLSFMGEPPFSTSPAKLIGSVYYSQEGVAANANFLADGMANFGFGGMLGASAVVGIWLGFVDLVAAELPAGIVFAAIAVVLVAFSNTASLTVLATHGGAASLIALWIVGEDWRRRSVAMQSAEEVSGSSKLAQAGDAQTL